MASEYEPTLIAQTTATSVYGRPKTQPRPGRDAAGPVYSYAAHAHDVHSHAHVQTYYGGRATITPVECRHEPPELGFTSVSVSSMTGSGTVSPRRVRAHETLMQRRSKALSQAHSVSRSFECSYEHRLFGCSEYQPAPANCLPLHIGVEIGVAAGRMQLESTRTCSLDDPHAAAADYSPTAEAYHSMMQAQETALTSAYTTSVNYQYATRFGCECGGVGGVVGVGVAATNPYCRPIRKPEIAIALETASDPDPTSQSDAIRCGNASDGDTLAVQTLQYTSRSFDCSLSSPRAAEAARNCASSTARSADAPLIAIAQTAPAGMQNSEQKNSAPGRGVRLTIPCVSHHPPLVHQRSADQSLLQPFAPDAAPRLVRSFETQGGNGPRNNSSRVDSQSQNEKEARLRSLTARRDKLTHAKSVIEAQAHARRQETVQVPVPVQATTQVATKSDGKPDENRRATMRRAQTTGMQRRESWLRCMNAGKIDLPERADADVDTGVNVAAELQEPELGQQEDEEVPCNGVKQVDAEGDSERERGGQEERAVPEAEAETVTVTETEATSDDRQNLLTSTSTSTSTPLPLPNAEARIRASLQPLVDRFGVSGEQIAMLVLAIRDSLALEQRHVQTLSELRQRDANVQTSTDSTASPHASVSTSTATENEDASYGEFRARTSSSSTHTQTEQDARDDELDSLKEYYELELEKQRSQHEMHLFRLKNEHLMRALQMKDEIDRLQRELEKYKILAGIETLTRDALRCQKRSEPAVPVSFNGHNFDNYSSRCRASTSAVSVVSAAASSKDAGTDTHDFDEVVRQLLDIESQKRPHSHSRRPRSSSHRPFRQQRTRRGARARKLTRNAHARSCSSLDTICLYSDSKQSLQSDEDSDLELDPQLQPNEFLSDANDTSVRSAADADADDVSVANVTRMSSKKSRKMRPLLWRRIQTYDRITVWRRVQLVHQLNVDQLAKLFPPFASASAYDAGLVRALIDNNCNAASVGLDGQSAVQKSTDHETEELELTPNVTADLRHALMQCDLSGPCVIRNLRVLAKALTDANPSDCGSDPKARLIQELEPLVPCFADRLECVVFQSDISEKLAAMDCKLELVVRACKSLTESVGIIRVLGLVLTVGNIMNNSQNQPDVVDAFHLDVLQRLIYVRSSEGSSCASLLQFIVNEYCRLYGDERGFPLVDPILLESASLIDLTHLHDISGNARSQLRVMESRVREILSCDDQTEELELFSSVMRRLVEDADAQLDRLESRFKEVGRAFQQTLVYFGYASPRDANTPTESVSTKTVSPKDFFSLWLPFLFDFRRLWLQRKQIHPKLNSAAASKGVK